MKKKSRVIKLNENTSNQHLSKGLEHKYVFPEITLEFVDKRNEEDIGKEIEKEIKRQIKMTNEIKRKQIYGVLDEEITRIDEKFIKKKVKLEEDIEYMTNTETKAWIEVLFQSVHFNIINEFETIRLIHEEKNKKWSVRQLVDINHLLNYEIKILEVKIEVEILNRGNPIEFVYMLSYDLNDLFGMHKKKIGKGIITRQRGRILTNEKLYVNLNMKNPNKNRNLYVICGVRTIFTYLERQILQNENYINLVEYKSNFISTIKVQNKNGKNPKHGYIVYKQ